MFAYVKTSGNINQPQFDVKVWLVLGKVMPQFIIYFLCFFLTHVVRDFHFFRAD